jgi:hypothetical protein
MSGIDVRNDTSRTIWLDEDPNNDASVRLEIEPEGLTFVRTDDCSQQRLEAHTRTGRLIAVLDQEWCPGQLWAIDEADGWSLDGS